jgi:hypothetical protein
VGSAEGVKVGVVVRAVCGVIVRESCVVEVGLAVGMGGIVVVGAIVVCIAAVGVGIGSCRGVATVQPNAQMIIVRPSSKTGYFFMTILQ